MNHSEPALRHPHIRAEMPFVTMRLLEVKTRKTQILRSNIVCLREHRGKLLRGKKYLGGGGKFYFIYLTFLSISLISTAHHLTHHLLTKGQLWHHMDCEKEQSQDLWSPPLFKVHFLKILSNALFYLVSPLLPLLCRSFLKWGNLIT